MATTSQRGYGYSHQRLRAALIAVYSPTDLCWRCRRALGPDPSLLHLGHVDGDKTRYAGLEHARCSTSAGGKYGQQLRGHDGSITRRRQRRRRPWRPPPDEPPRWSRVW